MTKVKVELSATVNLGNFQSVKVTVGFEEDAANRDEKFNELLEICSDKLDDAILAGANKIKAITGK